MKNYKIKNMQISYPEGTKAWAYKTGINLIIFFIFVENYL